MANPEHLAILRRGLEAWNQWCISHRIPGDAHDDLKPDLAGANLSERSLSGIYLREANLAGANCGATDFISASLAFANSSGVNTIRETRLCKRIWSKSQSGFLSANANLTDATLTFANLDGATLVNATLHRARVGRAIFTDTDLSLTTRLETVIHDGPSNIGIDTLYRSPGNIPEVFLRGAGVPESLITYAKSLLALPIDFYSYLVSYSHEDKPFARRLHDTLQGRGIRCWLDEKQLLPGDALFDHIDRGIRLWDKFLLCCSEHSLKPSSWVDKELLTALEKEDELTRQRGKKIHALIPLNLDGYIFTDGWKSGYRAQIRSRLAADFTG